MKRTPSKVLNSKKTSKKQRRAKGDDTQSATNRGKSNKINNNAEDTECFGGDDDGLSSGSDDGKYVGEKNSEGKAHGKGTLCMDDGIVFEGSFMNGIKEGKGILHFDDGSTLSGVFLDDDIEGEGVFALPNGERWHNTYLNGISQGPTKHYNSKNELTFTGIEKDGVKSGLGIIKSDDGGWYEGNLDEDGSLEGDDVTYFFSHNFTTPMPVLRGRWEDGVMVAAEFYKYKVIDSQHEPPLREYTKMKQEAVHMFDESTETVISKDLLLPDLYELELIYVKQSTIPDAGEGMFARVEIPPHTVVSFYNGIRLPDLTEDKSWYQNKNAISLIGEDVVIDVPEPYDNTNVYCASLGHKCNHSFFPNAKYDTYSHPRFGDIMCIRTLDTTIKPDEEVLVCYGYEMKAGVPRGPAWYVNGWRDVVDNKKWTIHNACKNCFKMMQKKEKKKNNKKQKKLKRKNLQ